MYPTLTVTKGSFYEFVTHWSNSYNYTPKHELKNNLYFNNICKDKFEENNLIELFTWKNGMPLNRKSMETIHLISEQVDEINRLKQLDSEELLNHIHINISISNENWKIYLLHILKPNDFPVLDLHTYRAYQYITLQLLKELKEESKTLMSFYTEDYIPFFQKHAFSYNNGKHEKIELWQIYKALHGFGEFLKSPYAKLIDPLLNEEFVIVLFSYVYDRYDGTFKCLPDHKNWFRENPGKQIILEHVLYKRDYYMESGNYNVRWEMGYFLMETGIEFAQSEGAELIFSFCLAIQDEFSISINRVADLLKKMIKQQVVL